MKDFMKKIAEQARERNAAKALAALKTAPVVPLLNRAQRRKRDALARRSLRNGRGELREEQL
jgi:hypothetical protein